MRTDSQNLLDRLDQSDFRYQEFQSADDARRGYGWPLLDIVGRAVAGRHRAPASVIAAPAPAPVPVAADPVVPPPAPAELAPPPARSFFARYGEAPATPAEANRQPGER
ncbi:MAG: hypothetical protein PGN09_10745 [Sphingomonas fennica]